MLYLPYKSKNYRAHLKMNDKTLLTFDNYEDSLSLDVRVDHVIE
jgi:hypothetical protein